MLGTVLLDTNIIIAREDYNNISEDMQILLNILNESDFKIVIHPKSFEDIERDKNIERKEIIMSKMRSYNILKSNLNFINDSEFKDSIKYKDTPNDFVDNCLLYSLFKDEVTFLITEDNGIHKNSQRLNSSKNNFSDRVFTINEAIAYFKKEVPTLPYEISVTTVDQLDINDPIFHTLIDSYGEFISWFKKIQEEKRKCLIFDKKEGLGALLIFKEEKELIQLKHKTLEAKNRIKIATMIVTSNGNKIGELFLSWIINYAFKNNIDELYLTHFSEGPDDPLIYLIEEYGFSCEGYNSRKELVYVKNINSKFVKSEINENKLNLSYLDLAKQYYPYFYDNENVKKFIVPIKEEFHKRLFLPNIQQTNLDYFFTEQSGIRDISRYVIKKAYLCNANIKDISPGDLILFYESNKKGISNIGVVETFFKDLSLDEITKNVGKRSVYSQEELKEFGDNNRVILFINSRKCKTISLDDLTNCGIIKGPPQSIQNLSHEKYLKLKSEMLK